MYRILATILLVCLSTISAAETITVAAAASLTEAFKEVGQAFTQEYPDSQVQFTFAGSGALLQQIRHGAPIDVFASADQYTMDQAVQISNLIAAPSRYNFASNQLVLITPNNAPKVQQLNDLLAPAFTNIAVGSVQSVPVGRYTKELLSQADLWLPLQDKLIYAQNVRQVLDYVARGEVSAGFVYATDAALFANRVKQQMILPSNAPVLYPIAAVADSSHPEMAQRFIHFVLSPQGQEILARYGFSPTS